LITPQTSVERIHKIDSLTQGFIYMVSSSSTTGASKGKGASQEEYFQRIAGMNLHNPRVIGFGISDRDSFSGAVKYADGAIIGSAFIKAVDKGGDLRENIADFISSIR
ncbi:MAG: tryptophan synthase subunit alpha, partial [Bacteroidota bacterium]